MRRRLLLLLSLGLVLVVGVATFVALRGSNASRPKAGTLSVDVSGLRPGHVIAVGVSLPDHNHRKARVFVVRDDAKPVMAFLGVSTHLGCRLLAPGDPRYGEGFTRTSLRYLFEDPCGGSVYALNGDCTGGPCPRGLDRYGVKNVDGNAEIDLKHLMAGPPRVYMGPNS